MGRTACTEPQCLYKVDLYLYLFLRGITLTGETRPRRQTFPNVTLSNKKITWTGLGMNTGLHGILGNYPSEVYTGCIRSGIVISKRSLRLYSPIVTSYTIRVNTQKFYTLSAESVICKYLRTCSEIHTNNWCLQRLFPCTALTGGPGSSVCMTRLRTKQSGDRIPVGRDFAPVQAGPGSHPASCTMGIESFLGVKYGRGVLLTTHPLLVPRSWKSRAIPLPTLWATTGL